MDGRLRTSWEEEEQDGEERTGYIERSVEAQMQAERIKGRENKE